jgi:GNAT superfamily N-acetyltransferase
MDGCSLRSCIVGDEHALALVGQATFLETFAGILDGADILAHCHTQHTAAVYAAWLRERAGVAVARGDHRRGFAPIGYLGLGAAELPVPDARETDIELKRIYVLKRFQGTGVGDALMGSSARDCARLREDALATRRICAQRARYRVLQAPRISTGREPPVRRWAQHI